MVTWSLRFVLWQAAAFLVVLGWCWWRRSMPRFGSVFGLRFTEVLSSPEQWRDLHARVGRMLFLMGFWMAVPLPSLVDTMIIQLVPVSVGSFVGVGIIRWRQVRRSQGRRPEFPTP